MAEMLKNKLDFNDFMRTSTVVEDTCFFMNIPEDKIKLENIEMQGKLDFFTFLNKEYRLKSLPGWFVFEGSPPPW